MVHIPSEIIEMEHIKPDEMVRLDVKKVKQDWFGKFKGVGHFTAEDELSTHD